MCCTLGFVFFKQKTAYEMRISDWSSDVCSSDLVAVLGQFGRQPCRRAERIEQLDDRRRVEALFLIVTGAARNVVGAMRDAQFGAYEAPAAILPSCRPACAPRCPPTRQPPPSVAASRPPPTPLFSSALSPPLP